MSDHEYIQIGTGFAAIEREGEGYRVPLGRGWSESPKEAHDRGLWVVISSPAYDDLGRDRELGSVALTLPALGEDDDSCLVSEAVGAYLDMGQILVQVRVIE